LRLEIGDAHRRWGQVGEAITAYTRVADQYMAEGFDARAVAVFKQIQNLDPEHYEAYVPLSALYERMGLSSEAIQALQTAADGLHKAGKKREALDLLRRMAALDPTNTSSRVKVADLLRQEGLTSDAVSEYEAARAELEKQGEHEAAGHVLERILEAEPDRLATVVALAQNLLKRGQGDAAEALAKRALETDDQKPEHYELLADVWRVQGRDDELKGTYKRLAELYRQRGDQDRARDIIQRFVPMEDFGPALDGGTQPNDLDPGLVGGMGTRDLAQPGGLDAPAGDADSEDPAEEFLEDEILMDEPADPVRSEPLVEETVLELSEDPEPEVLLEPPQPRELDDEPPAPPVEGDSDQLLAEASVYLRYGKRDQAIRNLEAVVEREPGHRAALEKLGEAYAEGSETSAAVDTWVRAAELSREAGDSEGLAVLRDRIGALDEAAAAGLGPEPSELVSDATEPNDELDDLIDFDDFAEEPEAESSAADELDLDDELDIDVDIDIDAIGMDGGARRGRVRSFQGRTRIRRRGRGRSE
jgi:tetratricopeptide (TPR) repeat protein